MHTAVQLFFPSCFQNWNIYRNNGFHSMTDKDKMLNNQSQYRIPERPKSCFYRCLGLWCHLRLGESSPWAVGEGGRVSALLLPIPSHLQDSLLIGWRHLWSFLLWRQRHVQLQWSFFVNLKAHFIVCNLNVIRKNTDLMPIVADCYLLQFFSSTKGRWNNEIYSLPVILICKTSQKIGQQ